uniref:MICOS complex subunit MIC25 n=1 Tax=Castor canadensis TaxID=51338 RepID=A0A8C0W9D3_CASCN|nr:MICOS complex subunit MIC25 [Castor canadensis]
MGSAESSESRRVSFGMDEEERVRVLQGIRLSENVVNRMKDSSQPSEGQQPAPPPTAPPPMAPLSTAAPLLMAPPSTAAPPPTAPPPSTLGPPEGNCKAPQKESKQLRSETGGGQQPSGVKEDLKRFKQEQAIVQEELFQVVKREREAALKHLKTSVLPEGVSTGHEKQQSAQLAKELQNREAELRRRDTFYKEQLGRMEKKNAEMYKLSSQQFHEAASKAESTIKPRRVEPVCSGLQAQILRCYRDHLHEVLLCSDLVNAYQHCVSTAHKG